MLLAIDAGNTNIVFAIYDGEKIAAQWRTVTQVSRSCDEYAVWLAQLLALKGLSFADLAEAIIATVVPASLFDLRALCRTYLKCEPLIVGDPALDLGIKANVERPHAVGADVFGTAQHRAGEAGIAVARLTDRERRHPATARRLEDRLATLPDLWHHVGIPPRQLVDDAVPSDVPHPVADKPVRARPGTRREARDARRRRRGEPARHRRGAAKARAEEAGVAGAGTQRGCAEPVDEHHNGAVDPAQCQCVRLMLDGREATWQNIGKAHGAAIRRR